MSSRHADSLPNRYETPAFSRNLVTYPQPVDDTRGPKKLSTAFIHSVDNLGDNSCQADAPNRYQIFT